MKDSIVLELAKADFICVDRQLSANSITIQNVPNSDFIVTANGSVKSPTSIVDSGIKIVIDEAEMAYAERVDTVGEDVIYRAEANAGSLDSSPMWRIRKITMINDDLSTVWANGTAEFVHSWNDRLTYTYR